MNPIHLSNQEIISCYLCTLDGLERQRNDMGTLAMMWLNLEKKLILSIFTRTQHMYGWEIIMNWKICA